MPYIKPEAREALTSLSPSSAGELNYSITLLVKEYLETLGESYQTYNDIIGALECAKLELYRRKISGYEDVKIKDNGDVY